MQCWSLLRSVTKLIKFKARFPFFVRQVFIFGLECVHLGKVWHPKGPPKDLRLVLVFGSGSGSGSGGGSGSHYAATWPSGALVRLLQYISGSHMDQDKNAPDTINIEVKLQVQI